MALLSVVSASQAIRLMTCSTMVEDQLTEAAAPPPLPARRSFSLYLAAGEGREKVKIRTYDDN